jgi:hypothetical protein
VPHQAAAYVIRRESETSGRCNCVNEFSRDWKVCVNALLRFRSIEPEIGTKPDLRYRLFIHPCTVLQFLPWPWFVSISTDQFALRESWSFRESLINSPIRIECDERR